MTGDNSSIVKNNLKFETVVKKKCMRENRSEIFFFRNRYE